MSCKQATKFGASDPIAPASPAQNLNGAGDLSLAPKYGYKYLLLSNKNKNI